MPSELQDTPVKSKWSDQDQEDTRPTTSTTTKCHSNPYTTTSPTATPEVVRDYVTSVAGEPVSDDDTEEFIRDLELWYDKADI